MVLSPKLKNLMSLIYQSFRWAVANLNNNVKGLLMTMLFITAIKQEPCWLCRNKGIRGTNLQRCI